MLFLLFFFPMNFNSKNLFVKQVNCNMSSVMEQIKLVLRSSTVYKKKKD